MALDLKNIFGKPLFKVGDFTVNVLSAIIAGLVVYFFTKKR